MCRSIATGLAMRWCTCCVLAVVATAARTAPQPSTNLSHLKHLSLLKNADPSMISTDPYPHIVIHNALDDDLYDHLASTYPDDQAIVTAHNTRCATEEHLRNISQSIERGRLLRNTALWRRERAEALRGWPNNARFDMIGTCGVKLGPALGGQWEGFLRYHMSRDFFQEIVRLFGRHILRTRPDIKLWQQGMRRMRRSEVEPRGGRERSHLNSRTIKMEVNVGINTPVREQSSTRGVHHDFLNKFVVGLLYLRHDNDTSTGGDLEVRSREGVVRTVAYGRNTFVMFVNTHRGSLHAVTPRSVTAHSRRLIDLTSEVHADWVAQPPAPNATEPSTGARAGSEVRALRSEVSALRSEVSALRGEVQRGLAEVERRRREDLAALTRQQGKVRGLELLSTVRDLTSNTAQLHGDAKQTEREMRRGLDNDTFKDAFEAAMIWTEEDQDTIV